MSLHNHYPGSECNEWCRDVPPVRMIPPNSTGPEHDQNALCAHEGCLPVYPGPTDGTAYVTSPTGGTKGQKLPRYDLIPSEALEEVAKVYGMGARKYEDNNWRKGYKWSLNFAALMRHAWAFWRGETYDPESGLHHMAHAVFHALALITNTTEHPDYDDRWKHDG